MVKKKRGPISIFVDLDNFKTNFIRFEKRAFYHDHFPFAGSWRHSGSGPGGEPDAANFRRTESGRDKMPVLLTGVFQI